jgi:hypothetical protein
MNSIIEIAKQAGISEWEIGVDGKARSALMSQRLARLERFAALVRNAALEEAARYCHDASIPQLDQIHTDAQWAAACLAVNIRNLMEPTT